jgi:hypothetical protein
MVHGWPLRFCGVDREVLLWGSLCHHVKREASRFIPSCVQRRLARSAGVSPAGEEPEAP